MSTTVPELLLIDEVGALLKKSRTGIYDLMRRGDLSPIYLDRRPRFDATEVAALIERAKDQAGAKDCGS